MAPTEKSPVTLFAVWVPINSSMTMPSSNPSGLVPAPDCMKNPLVPQRGRSLMPERTEFPVDTFAIRFP